MHKKNSIKLILENATKINQKYMLVKQSSLQRAANSHEWKKATQDFHDSYDQLAFPGGLDHALDALKKNDPATIDHAILYLEADPYFYRSGYIKQKIIRLLKQSTLSPHHILQLQAVLIANIQRGGRSREYCRLAKKIQTPVFIERLQEIMRTAKHEQIIEWVKVMLAVILG